MKCELVYVGTNVYVIGDRTRNMPPMRMLTDKRVIDLRRKKVVAHIGPRLLIARTCLPMDRSKALTQQRSSLMQMVMS